MPARRQQRWCAAETAVLREHYPAEGASGVQAMLPHRSWHSIYLKAYKLGIPRAEGQTNAVAPTPKLSGDALEEAIRLREQEKWSFARIADRFALSEAAACNALLIALCPRKGFTPAERDANGRLTEQGLARVRYALKKGLKGVDIQLRLGVSGSTVAEQRRRYNRELRDNGKAPLPQPGGGTSYSGVKLSRAAKAEVEALFMQGLGRNKISQRTGVSHTSVVSLRARLVRKLARKGQALPGCDRTGARHVQAESSRFVPEEIKLALRAMLLEQVPVKRAAALLALGACSAYRLRDQFAAELAGRGETLPAPKRPGSRRYPVDLSWPPHGARDIYSFRELLRDMSFDEAKAAWRHRKKEARRIDAARPLTFEEQLARVERGELGLAATLPRHHLDTTLLRPEQDAPRQAA